MPWNKRLFDSKIPWNLILDNPLEKMIPENKGNKSLPFQKGNCANLPPGKIYLDIESPKKIIIKGFPGFLHLFTCADKNCNSPFS